MAFITEAFPPFVEVVAGSRNARDQRGPGGGVRSCGHGDSAGFAPVAAIVVGVMFLFIGLSLQAAATREERTAAREFRLYGDSRIKSDGFTTGGAMIAAAGLVRLVGVLAT